MSSTLDALVTERDLQATVLELARLFGWRDYHSWTSIHSAGGFPDLVLVRRQRIIFAELKKQNGRTTPAQRRWLDALAECPGIETFLWRPSDRDTIARVLA